MKRLMMALLAVLITVAVTPAEAKHHSYKTHHYSSRSGACDGFHRCRCGTTQAAHFGLPLNYRGFNLKLAADWGRAFPRTGFHANAVGVKPHHVLRVVQVTGPNRAIVSDDAGTYERNISGFVFVSVTGGGDYTYSARSHHKHHKHYRQQVADISYQPIDRFGIQ